jgi:hypothetical protein
VARVLIYVLPSPVSNKKKKINKKEEEEEVEEGRVRVASLPQVGRCRCHHTTRLYGFIISFSLL